MGNYQLLIALAVLVFMIVSFLLHKISYGLTAMTCVIVLALTGGNRYEGGLCRIFSYHDDSGSHHDGSGGRHRQDQLSLQNPGTDGSDTGKKRLPASDTHKLIYPGSDSDYGTDGSYVHYAFSDPDLG